MEATGTRTPRSTGRVLAWALAAAGGIVALAGCLLPWIVLNFGRLAILVQAPTRTLSATAWHTDALGKTATICAVVLLVAAIVVASGLAGGARRTLAVLIIVTAAMVAFVALYEMARKGAYVDRLLRAAFSAGLHRQISDAEFGRLQAVLGTLGFSVSFGVGLYLAAIGGILGVIGGVLVLTGSKEPEPMAAGFATFADPERGSAMPPPAAFPWSASEPVRTEDPTPAPVPVPPAPVRPPVDPPPMPMPPDVPPPSQPPDLPPLPTPPVPQP